MRAIKLHRKHIRSIKLQATSILTEIHKGKIKIWKIRSHRIGSTDLLRVDFGTTAAPGQLISRFFDLEKFERLWDVWLRGELLVVTNRKERTVNQ